MITKIKTKTPHSIERAIQRYKLYLTEFDLMMICLLVKMGLGKEVELPDNIYGYDSGDTKCYHVRYGGKLIKPIIINPESYNSRIVTFLPTGKRVSFNKYCKNKVDKDYLGKMKRLGIRPRYI